MVTLENRSVGWRKRTFLVLIWSCTLFLLAGCGSLGKAKNAVTNLFDGFGGKGGRIKQKVALVPFQNRTIWDENQTHTHFMTQLAAVLEKKCSLIAFVKPGDPGYPESISRFFPPAVSSVDNIGLAKNCSEVGVNAVLAGQLTHISAEEVKRGIYGFRKTIRVARIRLDMELYHSGTAAKLMDESFSFDVEMVLSDGDTSVRKWVIDDAAMDNPLADTAQKAGKAVCETFSRIPWEGVILSVEGNKAFIPFGESSGLVVGDHLDVFNEGRTSDARGGHRYIIPGFKVGAMTLSMIYPQKAELTITEGGMAIKPGCAVRLK